MKKFILAALIYALFTGIGECATWYVDPGATGSGNGTSWANAYTSLNACLLAKEGVLSENMIINCQGATADTTAVVSTSTDGYTFGSYSITINGDNATGKWDASKYRITATGTQITFASGNWVFNQIQFGTYAAGMAIADLSGTASCSITVKNCIFNGLGYGNSLGIRIYYSATSVVWRIYNNVFFDYTGLQAILVNSYNDQVNYIDNNTFVDCYTAIELTTTGSIARNNIVKGSGNTNAYVGTFASGTDYNATDGTDDIGAGTHNHTGHTFTFTDESGNDFTLGAGDTGAQNLGIDLTSDANNPFSTDIKGTTRPTGAGTWEIGAFDFGGESAPETITNTMILGGITATGMTFSAS